MTKDKQKMSEEQLYQLILEVKQSPNNEALQEQLILSYRGLVSSLAQKYAHDYMNIEDLYQVGMIGLMNAVNRFDPSFGSSFETYAIPTITGEIKRYLRDKTWSVYVPRRVKELGPKIQKAIDELTITLEKTPSIEDIAHHLNIPVEELSEVMSMIKNYKSLSVDFKYNKSSEEKRFTILDVVGVDEKYFAQIERKILLESLLPKLEEREQAVLNYLFYDRLTQREVGEILGVSQMQISRLQKQALNKLRDELGKTNDSEL